MNTLDWLIIIISLICFALGMWLSTTASFMGDKKITKEDCVELRKMLEEYEKENAKDDV